MPPDWEIWLDNHISPIIAKWLRDDLKLEVKSSYALQLYGLSDVDIYKKAKDHGKIILISKDTDLDQIISFNGSPHKLIVLKIGNCHNRILFQMLKDNLPNAIRLLFDFNKDIIEINPHE
jgi:predicted nuclease of predicted toxin-antitoxin system